MPIPGSEVNSKLNPRAPRQLEHMGSHSKEFQGSYTQFIDPFFDMW